MTPMIKKFEELQPSRTCIQDKCDSYNIHAGDKVKNGAGGITWSLRVRITKTWIGWLLWRKG